MIRKPANLLGAFEPNPLVRLASLSLNSQRLEGIVTCCVLFMTCLHVLSAVVRLFLNFLYGSGGKEAVAKGVLAMNEAAGKISSPFCYLNIVFQLSFSQVTVLWGRLRTFGLDIQKIQSKLCCSSSVDFGRSK